MPKQLTSSLLALTLLTIPVVSCSSEADPGPGPSPTTVTTNGSGPVVIPSPPGVVVAAARLPCTTYVGTGPPSAGMRIVEGVVALPASPGSPALQTDPSSYIDDDHVRLFAKWGLVIRSGETFTLAVPRRLAQVAAIGWSNTQPTRSLTVPACRGGGARWLAFVGGYWVRRPLCLPLLVSAHGATETVRIGVGASCPGQDPPPETSRG